MDGTRRHPGQWSRGRGRDTPPSVLQLLHFSPEFHSLVSVCVLWTLGIRKLPIKTTTMQLETKMINQMLV